MFRDMKILRRSVPGTVSGRVWGLYHRPRIHASNLAKGAQGGRTFTNGFFGRKQRAAYGSGMGGAWFGLGGYEAGGNHWSHVFDKWFGLESIDIDVIMFHDENGSRDVRDEERFMAPYTPEELEALALRIRKRIEYIHVIVNESQRVYVDYCKALVDALEDIAQAKRTMCRVSMKAHFTLAKVITKFTGEGAPLLLVTKWDMEMLTAMHQNLGDALALAYATTMLLELKKAECTSIEAVERYRKPLSRRRHTLEDAERCKNSTILVTTAVGVAPERWFSAEDEKILFLVAEQLRQAYESAMEKLGYGKGMLLWKYKG